MFNTFLICSTINTKSGAYSEEIRFNQTLDTITSIRNKVDNAKIVFIDNSINTISELQQQTIKTQVDLYVDFKQNLFSIYANIGMKKSVGEMLMLEQAFNAIEKNNLIGKRIFKISGRYQLADTFNILEYNDPKYISKYIFRSNSWFFTNAIYSFTEYSTFYETKLWSMCGSLFSEFKNTVLQRAFNFMIEKNNNIEMAFVQEIAKEKIVFVDFVHVNGAFAETKKIIKE